MGVWRASLSRVALATLVLVASACAGTNGDESNDPSDAGGAGSGPEEAGADAAGGAAHGSAGCGQTGIEPGEERVTLRSGGEDRWYLRHVPPAHDGRTPVPLVVDIHGYSEGADAHSQVSQLGAYGDEQGFVTLTPHGRGQIPAWDFTAGGPDLAFVDALLDQAEASLCVDTARVFVTGLSMGAMMTSSLSCAFADRIAAAAPVAGVWPIADCEPARPVPVVAFHGTADEFLPYEGGVGPAAQSLPGAPGDPGDPGDGWRRAQEPPSVPELMAAWAERNDCDAEPPAEDPIADDVTRLVYPCPDGVEVELYRVEEGGHTWPGSELLAGVEDVVGVTTSSISANEVMWSFFQDHPLT